MSVLDGGHDYIKRGEFAFQLQPRFASAAGTVGRLGVFDHEAFVAAGLRSVKERVEFAGGGGLEDGDADDLGGWQNWSRAVRRARLVVDCGVGCGQRLPKAQFSLRLCVSVVNGFSFGLQ